MDVPRASRFKDVLQTVGDGGTAQALIFFLSSMTEASAALVLFYYIFEVINPGFICNQTEVVESKTNLTLGLFSLENSTWTHVCPEKHQCTNVTFVTGMTSMVTEWHLVCDEAYILKLTASLFFLGILIGSIVGGQLADIYGRRPVVLVSWMLVTITQCVLAAVPYLPLYMALRVAAGIGCGSCLTVVSMLPIEYIGQRWRSIVSIRPGWDIANFILILLAYFLRDWRHLAVAVGLLFTPVLFLSFWVLPESARWLIQMERYTEAAWYLRHVAKFNRTDPPSINALRQIGIECLRLRETEEKYSFIDLFRTKKVAIKTIVLMIAWFTCSMMSYGLLIQIPSLTGSIYINMAIIAAASCLVGLITPFFLEKLGRRISYPLFMCYPTVAMFAILALDLTGFMENHGDLRTGLALSSYAVTASAWQVVFMYSAEVYTTLVRGTSYGAGNIAARVGGVVAPLVSLLEKYHPSIPYTVLGFLAILSSVLMYLVMPETRGRSLPDGLPPRRRSRKFTTGSGPGSGLNINTMREICLKELQTDED